MSYRIIFTKPASRDLDEIGDYTNMMAGPAAAEQFVKEAIETAETPHNADASAGEDGARPGLRGVSVRNYMIFYRVHDDTVSIVRVLHGSRNLTAKLFPPDTRRP